MGKNDVYKSIGICTMCKKNNAMPGYALCEYCLEWSVKKYREDIKNPDYRLKKSERMKRYRERLKKNGICRNCGKRKVKPGTLCCVECLSKNRIRAERIRRKAGQGIRAYKEQVQERKQKGLCRWCDDQVVSGYCFCEMHLDQQRKKMAYANSFSKSFKKQNDLIYEKIKARRKESDT